jgi:hypothetical protein
MGELQGTVEVSSCPFQLLLGDGKVPAVNADPATSEAKVINVSKGKRDGKGVSSLIVVFELS